MFHFFEIGWLSGCSSTRARLSVLLQFAHLFNICESAHESVAATQLCTCLMLILLFLDGSELVKVSEAFLLRLQSMGHSVTLAILLGEFGFVGTRSWHLYLALLNSTKLVKDDAAV